MEENTELEEGEAPYNKEDDNKMDIDSLSYFDERIQHVLGHFQKDFEGGFSAENLGAKFGRYGSFLPTCVRPSEVYYPKNSHIEAAPDSSKSSSNITPKVGYSMKKDADISSNVVADRFPFKDDSTKKSGNSTDQRPLKFRLKMRSNMPAQNNAAISSGIGLDNTPFSSIGKSPDVKEGMSTTSQETAEESPTAIIQALSSFPIPGGLLLSPLHEMPLNLMEKEYVLGDRRSISSHDISLEHSSCFDELDSFMGGEQLLKERKQLELKRKNGNGLKKKITLLTTKRFENKTSDHKDLLSNGLKYTPLSVLCDASKVTEVSLEVNEDAVKARTTFSEAVNGEGKDSSKGDHSSSKGVPVRGKNILGAGNNSLTTDKKRTSFGVTSCKSQMHMTKPLKDYKVRDSNKESLKEKNVEHSLHRAITSVNCDNAEECTAYRIKIKKRPSGNKMGDQLISGLYACPVAEKEFAPEMVQAAIPQIIAEDWVCCDSCQKWRLLPFSVKPEKLPEKWLCSMLNWLPGMNGCHISEKETTEAVYALNQMPNSGSQNNLQNNASGSASGVSSSGSLHSGIKRQKSRSDLMSGRGKKRQDFRDKTKAGNNSDLFIFSESSETDVQESRQSRLLTDRCPGNSSPVRKCSDQCLIRSNNLDEEKHKPKEKIKVNRGDRKNIQLRCGIEADHSIFGTSKKFKSEDVHYSNSHLNPDTDQDMLERTSRKSMKVSLKGIRKYYDYCLSEDTKDKLIVPAKKVEDQAQVLSNGVPQGGNHALVHGNCVNGLLHENGVNKNNDLSYREFRPDPRNDVKYKFPESKHEKKSKLKPQDFENSVSEVDISFTTKSSIVSQQNLSCNSEKEGKADYLCTKLTIGKLNSLSSSDGDVKREKVFVSSRTESEAQKGEMFIGHSVYTSDNGNLTKLIKSSADARSQVRFGCNSGSFAPDRPHMSSPMRANSSLTASMTLDEATKLKNMADNFKNSGFEFESNETYFEAALKFLHGASLLECCHIEGSKHGEMSHVQLYATTAKLFKSCAHEYQRRQEMAAAALAYKCMEVACMRLIYCKHSSSNRMWHELQSTLNMVPQGESPSSSVSDVDNFNNQAAVEKTTLSSDPNTHLAANQVISVQNSSTFFQLLEVAQDVNLAMEASRECLSTFADASTIMEEAWNKEYVASIRMVIDFSFQDIDKLVRLVSAAKKAIARVGLDGVRD